MDSGVSQSKSPDAEAAAKLLQLPGSSSQWTKAWGQHFCEKYWPAGYTVDRALALGCLKVTQTIHLPQQAGL